MAAIAGSSIIGAPDFAQNIKKWQFPTEFDCACY
jgi:hypothetical protein